jgi:putative lipoic acid-binding regulatory protein
MTDLHNKPETLIEFPCHFELKAMGRHSEDFIDLVFGITQKYVPDVNRGHIRLNPSKENKFVSVKIKFYATHIQQIHGIYGELNEHPDVLMTLLREVC